MARRDVDLVIKARDEAAKVVDSITKSLNLFIDAQKDLDTRSGKTENTMTALGTAIGRLDQQMKGLSAGNALAQELGKSEAALTRLEQRFETTQVEAASLGRKLKAAEDATGRYTAKLLGAANAQERQRAALKKAKADQSELTASYKRAVIEQDKLARRQAILPGLLSKAGDAAKKAAVRFDDLSAQVAGTVDPTQRLQGQLERSQGTVTRTAERLAKLRTEYGKIGGQLNAAGSAVVLFAGQSERAASTLQRQEGILAKIGQNYETLKAKSSAASTQQNKLASSFDKTTNSLAKQTGELAQAQGDYAKLGASADQARVQLQKLATSGFAELVRTLQDQKRSVLEAKRAYVEASASATKLGAAISKVKKPSADMVAAFSKAKVTSAQLKTELLQQRLAYRSLSSILEQTERSIDGVRVSQQQFVAIQSQLTAALERSEAAAREQAAAISRLHGVTGSATASARQLASAQRGAANANERAASSTGRLAASYRQFYGDTRRSLGLLQRIRGEVLSLVAAYAGLYAGIQVLKGTVDATQALEAATARLNVAFENDTGKVAQELDFLRRTAERLGVNFGVLSTEYSKFAIATKNTALEGAAARKVFLQITEAARVNRSATKELSGVFVALTQIVSKGAVQMEELRQQLGDRLPGAVQIMADALGVGTAELFKMIEAGEVTEGALIKFGDEIEKRFSGGLDEALSSLTVAMGRLGNEAFQALVKFGQAGFIEKFQKFVVSLTTTLQSADFEAFAARASRALGGILDTLGFLAENFQVVIVALTALISFRLVPVILFLVSSFGKLNISLLATTGGFAAVQARAATMGVTITRAGFAVRSLTRLLRGLLSTTGIGLLFVGIATAVAAWSTEADAATEAMNEHRKLVDQVKNAYDLANGSIKEWRENIEAVTETRARDNLLALKDLLEETRDALGDAVPKDIFGDVIDSGALDGFFLKIDKLIKKFDNNEISAKDLRTEIDQLFNTFREDGPLAIGANATIFDRLTEALVANAEATADAQAILDAKNGTDEEAIAAAKELNLLTEEAVDVTGKYEKALQKLSRIAGEIAKSVPAALDKTEDAADAAERLAQAYQDALTAARALPEAIQRAAAEQQALTLFTEGMRDALRVAEAAVASSYSNFTNGLEAATALIIDREGFLSTPEKDNGGEFRAGFGSDTFTDINGEFTKMLEGMNVSIEDATRDLARRLKTQIIPALEDAVGKERFNSLTPQQQAGLVSITYNYGRGELANGGDLSGLVKAVREGSKEGVIAAIIARSGDNGGINRGRRIEEAALFGTNSGVEAVVKDQAKAAEAAADFHQSQVDNIETMRQEAALQTESLIAQEQGKALREAELAARKEGTALTASEIEGIKAAVAAKFAMKQAEEEAATAREKAVDAEQRVNALLAQRRALEAQLVIEEKRGDGARTEELRDHIAEVNTELTSAIENAKAMWSAIGGADADTAIIKLETAALKASNLDDLANKNYLHWNKVSDLFVRGLANAFDTFAKSIANGENVFDSAKNAFLQFAADFLLQIARMIIQQAIFNALTSAFGGSAFGSLIGLGHTGGVVGESRVGSGNGSRTVSPFAFAGAARFHGGGIAGLRPGEVPIIAKKGEEILTEGDPRHMMNGGTSGNSGGSPQVNLTNVNTFDPAEMLEAALDTPSGEQVFFNFINANPEKFKSAIN